MTFKKNLPQGKVYNPNLKWTFPHYKKENKKKILHWKKNFYAKKEGPIY